MILPIFKDNHPILLQKSELILEITSEIVDLARNMFETMHHYKGVGLSAPQVGHNINLIVFDCINYTMNSKDSAYMINPEIINYSGRTVIKEEGCLSYQGERYLIERDKKIKVKYLDLTGKEVVEFYTGLASRIIQHERDHLLGITFHKRRKV